MKKIIKNILSLFIIIFALFSIFNYSLAENTTNQVSSQTAAAESANQAGTQITTTVSSTSSAEEGFLSPTNIINILLISVGVVIIFLAIAILMRLKG